MAIIMLSKQEILDELSLFKLKTGGLGSWITEGTDPEVFIRLGKIQEDSITKVQLNQLLAFGHEAPVSDDFFRYYWLDWPAQHPYDVASIPNFESKWVGSS